jgi:uncharacterized protein DUF4919
MTDLITNRIYFYLIALFLFHPLSVALGQHTEQNLKSATDELATRQAYQTMVQKVKAGDSTVDFVELIAAASDWDLSSKTVISAPNRDVMVEAFKKKDYKKATDLAEQVLDYEFTNRSLHRATENAYIKLGDKARAEFHHNIAEKLLSAILSTGDGQSPQTAYCVQGIREEYVIMDHFGYEVSSQAYLGSGESTYDMLSGVDRKSKKAVSLYFDISGLFRRCINSHRKDQN